MYTFKHALVQDAAYDPLLKSRRQELHTKIARVIEQRFPSIKTTEPDVAESLPLAREMLDLAEANGIPTCGSRDTHVLVPATVGQESTLRFCSISTRW